MEKMNVPKEYYLREWFLLLEKEESIEHNRNREQMLMYFIYFPSIYKFFN